MSLENDSDITVHFVYFLTNLIACDSITSDIIEDLFLSNDFISLLQLLYEEDNKELQLSILKFIYNVSIMSSIFYVILLDEIQLLLYNKFKTIFKMSVKYLPYSTLILLILYRFLCNSTT